MKKKGQMLDTWGTVIVFIIGALIVMVMLVVYLIGTLSGKMDIEIAVEKFKNRPYLIGELLSHQKIDDRSFLEHATETVVSNGIENSKSYGAKSGIEQFMEKLGIDKKKYHITIKDNKNSYVEVGEKQEAIDPKSVDVTASDAEISNNAVIPLLYKKDESHPEGILGYINIVTEGG
ncbi:MAG: hypothetical protein HZB67_00830 [Candidatus Aenigmarchaeota archaeon]|nr:hypothetical protein [Candidatus Aenigmarchaeota archaeon]